MSDPELLGWPDGEDLNYQWKISKMGSEEEEFHCAVCRTILEAQDLLEKQRQQISTTIIIQLKKVLTGGIKKRICPQDNSSRNAFGKRPPQMVRARSIPAHMVSPEQGSTENACVKLEGHTEAVKNGETLEIVVKGISERIKKLDEECTSQKATKSVDMHPNKEVDSETDDEISLEDKTIEEKGLPKLTWKEIPKVLRASGRIIGYYSTVCATSVLFVIFKALEMCWEYFLDVVFFVNRCTYPNGKGIHSSDSELTTELKETFGPILYGISILGLLTFAIKIIHIPFNEILVNRAI